jgi:ubiquinone/menaquinone biosynthesis C-methylase UbiE
MENLFRESILPHLPKPVFTRPINLKLFEWMNQNAPGKTVLNLGSGIGTFDHHLSQDIRTINMDIDPAKPNLHVIADAHFLPFGSASVDIVYSIAVLEHVRKPWIVADEITRILSPGGYVVLELPFLNVIHDKHDYFRFTDKGIRSLFGETNFEMVLSQVGSGGGSFLSVFFLYYFQQFFPTKLLRLLWLILMAFPSSLFKYLDILIKNSQDLRITANSFSFIGKKR